MPVPQVITFTTTGTDTTAYTKVTLPPGNEGPSSRSDIPSQALRVGGTLNASGGTATIRFVRRSATTIYGFVDVTFAASALRTAVAGGSGNYMATVTATNGDFIDLTGYGGSVDWYVGCTAMAGSATSVDVHLDPTRAT